MTLPIQSPRVGLMLAGPDGWPAIPPTAQIPGVGAVPVADTVFAGTVGSHPSREYRLSTTQERLVTIVRLAPVTLPDGRSATLVVAWVPAPSRLGDNATYDLLIASPSIAPLVVATWPVVDAGGALTVPGLDADATTLGALARAAWPDGWRVRLPTDDPGDPLHGVPAAPATGPRALMEVLA